MKRKVNLVGQSTLTVSLPSKWVEKNNIKKGDEIDLVETEREIRIGLSSIKSTRDISFNIENKSHLMNRTLFGPYLRGYSSITYHYKDPAVYTKLLGSVKKMLGFEIVDQTQQKCKLEEVSEGTNQNFGKLMMRLLFILKSYSEAVQTFLKNPRRDYSDFAELELECDKISLYCRRLINKNYLSGPIYDSTAFYHVLCATEQLGDELDDIIDYYRNGLMTKYKYDTSLDVVFIALNNSLDAIFKKIDNYLNGKNEEKRLECDMVLSNCRQEVKQVYKKNFSKTHTNIISLHLFTCINLIKHMSEELF